jgi:hypothetical protein
MAAASPHRTARAAAASPASRRLSTIRPPTGGESTAIRPRPLSARDIIRAPAAGSNRSRRIERPQVTAAAIAAPCSARQAISVSMLAAAALARLASV